MRTYFNGGYYMTSKELKAYYTVWKKHNLTYQNIFKNTSLHVAFSEKIQKEIILKYFKPKLTLSKGVSAYDFAGNIELKSSTSYNGCTPFKSTQNNCMGIIYLEVDCKYDEIRIYNLSLSDVHNINKLIIQGNLNISLGMYKVNATLLTIKM